MTNDRNPTDDQLLDMLKDALDHSVEVTDDNVDMIMTGYDIVNLDSLEAELTFDSLTATGVRAGTDDVRHLRFEHGSTRIDIELNDVTRRCTGHVAPAGGSLSLEQVSGTASVELTESGSFNTIIEGVGPFRISYEIDDTTVSTSWIQLSADDH